MPNPVDQLVSHQFVVEIDGVEAARFTESSGLQMTTDVFEYKEGGLNGYTHRLPGRVSYSTLSLKRGVADGPQLYAWYTRFNTAADKTGELKNISIVLYKTDHTEALRWNLHGAFPVKWSSPSLVASSSDTLIETFDLAFADAEVVRQ
ncbi:MAG: phage tail protein [Thermoflexaceae bacterium]|jgi:phage tail-like protein|nr:phage tail protein [Thermoflexaceae bacterium]